jgi:UPF0716 family protein affecting phage T7 exclusion
MSATANLAGSKSIMSDVAVFTIGALLALMPGLVVLALFSLREPIDEELSDQ